MSKPFKQVTSTPKYYSPEYEENKQYKNKYYFYDGMSNGDMAHFYLEQEAALIDQEDLFEDVPY